MLLPTFTSLRRPPRSRKLEEKPPSSPASSDPTALDIPSKTYLRHATRPRLYTVLLSVLSFLIALPFLILVVLGSTQNTPVLTSLYFLRLDLSYIIPRSVPNSRLINSIARTVGLHDFYQVGLWNFCEGYASEGVTSCASPRAGYAFNPVDIILDELLAGATIALPGEITKPLAIARTASRWMFGLFMTGTVLTFVSLLVTPFSLYTRWNTLLVSVLTFLAAFTTTAASIVATALFVIFRNVFSNATEVNIGATLGVKMFIIMWIGCGCTITGWLIQMGMLCCCASRRDVKTGRKRGRKKAI
ncbi:MAG: hypothetical protein M1817_006046 [Caeruleum heppii]|nr:MAG: hypothetical protein M1817_006046 [Caeruleum heppii]